MYLFLGNRQIVLTATKGYTFCIESNNEEIVNTPALTTLIKENLNLENDIIVIKSRLKNKCRLFVIENDLLRDQILHEYDESEEEFVMESFLTDLCLTYEYPLCGYITSSTPVAEITELPRKILKFNNDDTLFVNCNKVKFPFFVCNFYTNSNPIMLDNAPHMCENTIVKIVSLLPTTRYRISHIERCVLNRYTKFIINNLS